MASNKDNTFFEKTSFLQGGNSIFIKELYLKYLKDSDSIPISWKEFFDGLNDSQEIIQKEILGPSWVQHKNNLKNIINLKNEKKDEKIYSNRVPDIQKNSEKEKTQSVKAIALIRAYRIRGHLIANLDPLEIMKRDYLHELHPNDHGFKKEDYNKKIYLNGYLDRNYATVNEMLLFLRKTYCSTIGVEYMHISDPIEKYGLEKEWKKKSTN